MCRCYLFYAVKSIENKAIKCGTICTENVERSEKKLIQWARNNYLNYKNIKITENFNNHVCSK